MANGIVMVATDLVRPSVKSILLPISLPLLILVPMELYLATGGVLYAHGSSMLLLLIAVSLGVAAFVWELLVVPVAAYRLMKNPTLRSRLNVLTVIAGAIYVIGALVFGVEMYLQAA